jgi:hypothetical protein
MGTTITALRNLSDVNEASTSKSIWNIYRRVPQVVVNNRSINETITSNAVYGPINATLQYRVVL